MTLQRGWLERQHRARRRMAQASSPMNEIRRRYYDLLAQGHSKEEAARIAQTTPPHGQPPLDPSDLPADWRERTFPERKRIAQGLDPEVAPGAVDATIAASEPPAPAEPAAEGVHAYAEPAPEQSTGAVTAEKPANDASGDVPKTTEHALGADLDAMDIEGLRAFAAAKGVELSPKVSRAETARARIRSAMKQAAAKAAQPGVAS